MFKSKRRKELEQKENELYNLNQQIGDLTNWCAHNSPEIGFAMDHLQSPKTDISGFRDKLRNGEFTFDNFKKLIP